MRLEYRSGSEPSSSIYHRTEETSSNRVVRFPLHLFVLLHQLAQSHLLIALRLLTDKRLRVLKEGTNQPVWDIWAIGDASVIEGELLPATAQVAAQKSTVRPSPFLLSIPSSPLVFFSMFFPLLIQNSTSRNCSIGHRHQRYLSQTPPNLNSSREGTWRTLVTGTLYTIEVRSKVCMGRLPGECETRFVPSRQKLLRACMIDWFRRVAWLMWRSAYFSMALSPRNMYVYHYHLASTSALTDWVTYALNKAEHSLVLVHQLDIWKGSVEVLSIATSKVKMYH